MVKLNLKLPQLSKTPRRFIFIGLGIISFYLLIFLYILIIGLISKNSAVSLISSLKSASNSLQTKDLRGAEASLITAQSNLDTINSKFKLISFLRFVPGIGGYINDVRYGLRAAQPGLQAVSLVVESIKPYADILGFSGTEASLNIQSAEEKIIFILQTLDKISPQMEAISVKITQVESEISQIKPKHYPQSFKGQPVRQQLINLQLGLSSSQEALANIKPLLALLPTLLGEPDAKKYLLLFQNDAELRPTGGFITAYAILETFKGKITPQTTLDIYELDSRFGNRLPAPEPIKRFLPLVYNWHLRDMNLSPDFKVSMDTFYPNYQAVAPIKDVNGIIAIDTQILVDLLDILGEIGVADWGNYSAKIVPECNCPQVVYKMEDYATRPTYYIKENRKGMIGPLMHSILLNVMNSPKKLWPKFLEIGLININEKHLMFYFPGDNNQMQAVAEAFNASGRIKEFNGDYFHLNDTNFAGAKSNLYVEQTVDQVIDISADGTITKTVTVEYKNPEPPDDCNLETGGLCLNGILRDWIRLYVPEGSQIVEVLGSDIAAKTDKDLGKTYIEAFVELRPQSKAKLIIKYRLPFKADKTKAYKLLIQKQPGTKNVPYTVSLGNNQQTFSLEADKEISF
ncbi:MAG: DUF4012 domain-containing protein [Candidatus Beckwithbacteria bacterium]